MTQLINKAAGQIFVVMAVLLLFIPVAMAADESSAEPPKVPFQYSLGVQKYQSMCASCHGQWLEGTKTGPPLLHPFYKPSHHADPSFYRAALQGVKAHHWEFGDMPPVPGATRQDMDAIVPFVRWFQREKGLYK